MPFRLIYIRIALAPMWHPQLKAETLLSKAREQTSQIDILKSLTHAIDELASEVKHMDRDVRKVRRDVQVSRR